MSLPVYFAPLEGVTDAPFRRVHHACFPGIAKYFIPFISPTQNLTMTARDLSAVSPEHNAGLYAVPQILTRDAAHFLWAAHALFDMGYAEINLNLGCPSGTVTAKGKGSGMLTNLPHLESFLDEIYAHSPAAVSIKTRIGFASADEFAPLLALLSRYPVHELIVHPRTRAQFYGGTPHREAYAAAHDACTQPLVYNGDLFTPGDCAGIEQAFPKTAALMLGRGLIANPALAQTCAGGAPVTVGSLRCFHDELMEANLQRYPKNVALGRMREVMKHMICCFDGADKVRKAIRKANNLEAYSAAAGLLFSCHPLRKDPGFLPDT